AGGVTRVDLRAREAELEICGGHHREHAVLETEPVARPVLDRPVRHPPEAALDRVDRLRGREQLCDLVLAEMNRHDFFSMKLIVPLVSITPHATSSSDAICCWRAASVRSSIVSRSRRRFFAIGL